ncbi:peptidase S8/S53 domain-containing protein [Syncephalis plumigaleata]|nr:peptidase S8/S53 domain-containing protein [Syncephalis plumigaleata]
MLLLYIIVLLSVSTAYGINYSINYPKEFVYNSKYRYPFSKITGKPLQNLSFYKEMGIDRFYPRYQGQGIRIGIMSTGLNYGHSGFGSHFNAEIQTIVGFDFVGREFNGYNKRKQSGDFIDTCNDHGTNLAGIIGVDSPFFKGIAPKATLGIYKVFGCTGPTTTTVVLEALNRAILHRMQIIMMPEIGIVKNDFIELRAKIEDAAKENIIILTAANNANVAGTNEFMYVGLPVILVGSASIPFKLTHWFTEVDTNERIAFTSICNNMDYSFREPVEVVPVVESALLTPGPYSSSLRGKVLLVPMFKQTVESLIDHAKNVGAVGIIVSKSTLYTRMHCKLPLFNIGKSKLNYLMALGRKYKFSNEFGNVLLEKATLTALSNDAEKSISPLAYPDILAPGTSLMTSVIGRTWLYGLVDHQNAAVAYLAGAISIILESQGGNNIHYETIKELLQRNAEPVESIATSSAAPFARQGAGLFNLHRTLYSNIKLKPYIVDFKSHSSMQQTTTIYINDRIGAKQYRISHKVAKFILINDKGVKTELNPNNSGIEVAITIPKIVDAHPGHSAPVSFTIKIAANIHENHMLLYSGYITVSAIIPNSNAKAPETASISFHGTMVH